jgi:hypothetical protein
MSQNIEYRLFYANSDKESMNIYNIIMQNGMTRLFQMTDVTELTLEQLQSLHMKAVPTIVISSPTSRPEVYDGPKHCSLFLNNLIMNRRTLQNQETETRMKMIQKAQRDARLKTEGPSEYSEAEMAGMSDTYAYMQTDMAQPKSCVLVGQEDATAVITPQLNESKIGKRQMSADLATLEREREQNLNNYKTDMEQRQIDAIFGQGF